MTPLQSARRDTVGRSQHASARASRSHHAISAWARRWQRALILLVVLACVAALGTWVVGGVAQWLIVADPLQPAAAIVVFGGGMPFRAMEAAALCQPGWAPQVWVTRGAAPAAEAALARLGEQVLAEAHDTRQVLERLEVPAAAIRLLPAGVQNTVQEAQLIGRELRHSGGNRVILVTSRPHTRRLRGTWRALLGDTPQAVVRYAAEEPYDAARWWRHTPEALDVSREVFELLNVWAGFPVRSTSR